MPRRIALTLPSFLGAGELVAGSEMIAVVPEQLARHITRRYPNRKVLFLTPVFGAEPMTNARVIVRCQTNIRLIEQMLLMC
jgi:mannose/fructose-specific phosphotransferase system component IIA